MKTTFFSDFADVVGGSRLRGNDRGYLRELLADCLLHTNAINPELRLWILLKEADLRKQCRHLFVK